jgi:hypothetical protein
VRATVVPPDGGRGPNVRFVRIELPGKGKLLQLAEVQVFSGGENVAVKGVASQKTTYTDAVAARAIDENTNGEYAKGSVAHTGDNTDDPWWEVDLKREQTLDAIVVWNRTEVPERLAGFRVVALNEQRQTVWEKADNGTTPEDLTFELNGGRGIKFTDATADFEQADFEEDAVVAETPLQKPKRGKKTRGPQKGWAIGGSTATAHWVETRDHHRAAVAVCESHAWPFPAWDNGRCAGRAVCAKACGGRGHGRDSRRTAR